MLVPVTCLTCGVEIGHLAELYTFLREQVLRKEVEARGVVPRKALVDLRLSIDNTPIMEKLGVRDECCRTHLSTSQIWTDFH